MAADWNILAPYFGTALRSRSHDEDLAVKRREGGKALAALNEARKLAAPAGIEIDRDAAGGYWVTCPSLDPDPMDGANFCSDGKEALSMVKDYVEHLKKNA